MYLARANHASGVHVRTYLRVGRIAFLLLRMNVTLDNIFSRPTHLVNISVGLSSSGTYPIENTRVANTILHGYVFCEEVTR